MSDEITVVVTETAPITVTVSTNGEQGPPGPAGQGITTGALSEIPNTPSEGDLFAATDTDELYVYFE